jgi:hypothetical protein
MIDEKAVKLEARLSAIEYFLCEAWRVVYALTGVPHEAIDRSHEHFREHLRTMEMPPSDPAISDLAAAELQESHERLLDMIARTAKAVRKPI